MFESKYNKLLTIILIVVVIAIIGLLTFLAINYFNSASDTEEAAQFVSEYQGDDEVTDESDETDDSDDEDNTSLEKLDEVSSDENSSSSSGTTKKKTYKGYIVNGTMEIPKTNFSYPVLEEYSKKSLETSVVLLYGAGLNQVGNTVIIGHNYRNGQFFSNNKKLSTGDKIYITDYTGNKVTYTIYNKFETTPEDTSFYTRDTNGKAEITLSTCTDDSSARLIIFAKADD